VDGAHPQRLTADPLPIEDLDADPAFHVYLLGPDSVAAHPVTFTADGTGGHRIDRTARVALTYVGDEPFDHGLRAEIHGARRTRVAPTDGMSAEEAAKWRGQALSASRRSRPRRQPVRSCTASAAVACRTLAGGSSSAVNSASTACARPSSST
jgi:hypothetical protein